MLLSNRNVYLLILGQTVSLIGDNLSLIVLPLLILDYTGSALQVSIIFILTDLPSFLGIFAGILRQHFSSKKLLIFYDIIRFLLMLGIAVTTLIKPINLNFIYFLFFSIAFFSSLFRPTRSELVTHIISPNSLKSFNSIDQSLEAVATALGFGLGGYAYAFLPIHWVFIFDSMTFLISALSIIFIRKYYNNDSLQEHTNVKKISIRKVFSQINRQLILSYLVYGEMICGVAFGIFVSILAIYIKKSLGADSITFGNLQMVQALMSTFAGLIIGTNIWSISNEKMSFSGYLGMAICILLLAFNHSIFIVYLLMAGVGIFNMMYFIANRTLLQLSSERNELIHILSVEATLGRISFVIGAAAVGSITDYFSLTANWAFLVAGALFLTVGLWGLKVYLSRPQGNV